MDVVNKAQKYDFAKNAAALILLSCMPERTTRKYGAFGYKLALLEAGHIGQNIVLSASAIGIGVAPLGGLEFSIGERELGLGGTSESLIYEFALGWEEIG